MPGSVRSVSVSKRISGSIQQENSDRLALGHNVRRGSQYSVYSASPSEKKANRRPSSTSRRSAVGRRPSSASSRRSTATGRRPSSAGSRRAPSVGTRNLVSKAPSRRGSKAPSVSSRRSALSKKSTRSASSKKSRSTTVSKKSSGKKTATYGPAKKNAAKKNAASSGTTATKAKKRASLSEPTLSALALREHNKALAAEAAEEEKRLAQEEEDRLQEASGNERMSHRSSLLLHRYGYTRMSPVHAKLTKSNKT